MKYIRYLLKDFWFFLMWKFKNKKVIVEIRWLIMYLMTFEKGIV